MQKMICRKLYHKINCISIAKVVSEITIMRRICAYLLFSTSTSNLEKAWMQIHNHHRKRILFHR